MPTRHPHDDTPDTEQSFHHLAATSQGRERDVLVEELVTAWLPMAHRIARRFRNKGENAQDLQQVAALGLLKAVERYNPTRGAFPSFAVPTITGELRRHFRDHSWDVHVPRRVQDLRNKVRIAHQDLMAHPGHRAEPDLEDIAAHAGLTLQEVRDGMEAWDSHSSLSLDAEMGTTDGDGYSLADTLGHSEAGYALANDREAAKQGLARLPARERKVLYLRFFEDKTQSQIAQEIGLSQMHVSRLITQSCEKVRRHANATPAVSQAA
ncbi:SigB/SigF/SigG family RNA polymerase sigma factor [Streptomyces venezuelae]|uniref:SigB/SigF/SigG family RNA polymerase sigma factor n=1 Tax=Streptomyces venezuelae TaxID=54571 RepID=UPI003451B00C